MAKLFMVTTRKGAIRIVKGQPVLVGDSPKTRKATVFASEQEASEAARAVSHPGRRGRPAETTVVELAV